MKVIAITGTPGTGKTTVAKALAKKINYQYIDVNKIIKQYNLVENYDPKRQTKEVSTTKLNKTLKNTIKKNSVIDSHLSHYLPKDYINLCVVLKCNLKELKTRLIKRKYSKPKIKENIEAETFDTSLIEATKHKRVLVFNTSKDKKKDILEIIEKTLKNQRN